MDFCLLTRFHSRHSSSNFILRLVDEAKAQGHTLHLINPTDITLSFNQNQLPLFYKGQPFRHFDLIHYALRWDDNNTWDIIETLKQWGYPVIPPNRVPLGDTITMARLYTRAGILIPRTWVLNSADQLPIIMPEISYPFMLRARVEDTGRKVMVVRQLHEAMTFATQLSKGGQSFLVQEIPVPTATDIRVFVVGDQILAAIERMAPMAQVRPSEVGNLQATPTSLSQAEVDLVMATMRVYGAPYAAVSILRRPTGYPPMLLEVTRAPTFIEAEKSTGLNLVAPIITHLAQQAQLSPPHLTKPSD